MAATPRLALGLISPGQAQKELFHNEALQVLDLLVGASVEEAPRNDPPASPANGACYIVGPAPSGAWSGKAQQIAGYTSGGWRFVAPFEGLFVHVRDGDVIARHNGSAWTLSPAVAAPAGGTTVDAEARASIAAILSALRQHGLIAG